MGGGDPDASHRLAEMEKEVDARKAEVAALKEQVGISAAIVVLR